MHNEVAVNSVDLGSVDLVRKRTQIVIAEAHSWDGVNFISATSRLFSSWLEPAISGLQLTQLGILGSTIITEGA